MRFTWLLVVMAGCAPTVNDFIEAHGSFADGTRLDVHLAAVTISGPSAQPQLGDVIALTAAATGPGTLRGLRLEWLPGKITVGTPQTSAPGGPVIFYVGGPVPDAGTNEAQLSVVNGGSITFTENDRRAAGTLANLVLSRRDAAGTPHVIVTLDSGSFSASNP